MGPLERVLPLMSAGFAVLLVVARTALPSATPGPLLVAASWSAVGLAVVTLVAAFGRMGGLHGDGEWSRRVASLQGTLWRQRRAVTVAVLSAARWRRIGASFLVQPDAP